MGLVVEQQSKVDMALSALGVPVGNGNINAAIRKLVTILNQERDPGQPAISFPAGGYNPTLGEDILAGLDAFKRQTEWGINKYAQIKNPNAQFHGAAIERLKEKDIPQGLKDPKTFVALMEGTPELIRILNQLHAEGELTPKAKINLAALKKPESEQPAVSKNPNSAHSPNTATPPPVIPPKGGRPLVASVTTSEEFRYADSVLAGSSTTPPDPITPQPSDASTSSEDPRKLVVSTLNEMRKLLGLAEAIGLDEDEALGKALKETESARSKKVHEFDTRRDSLTDEEKRVDEALKTHFDKLVELKVLEPPAVDPDSTEELEPPKRKVYAEKAPPLDQVNVDSLNWLFFRMNPAFTRLFDQMLVDFTGGPSGYGIRELRPNDAIPPGLYDEKKQALPRDDRKGALKILFKEAFAGVDSPEKYDAAMASIAAGAETIAQLPFGKRERSDVYRMLVSKALDKAKAEKTIDAAAQAFADEYESRFKALGSHGPARFAPRSYTQTNGFEIDRQAQDFALDGKMRVAVDINGDGKITDAGDKAGSEYTLVINHLVDAYTIKNTGSPTPLHMAVMVKDEKGDVHIAGVGARSSLFTVKDLGNVDALQKRFEELGYFKLGARMAANDEESRKVYAAMGGAGGEALTKLQARMEELVADNRAIMRETRNITETLKNENAGFRFAYENYNAQFGAGGGISILNAMREAKSLPEVRASAKQDYLLGGGVVQRAEERAEEVAKRKAAAAAATAPAPVPATTGQPAVDRLGGPQRVYVPPTPAEVKRQNDQIMRAVIAQSERGLAEANLRGKPAVFYEDVGKVREAGIVGEGGLTKVQLYVDNRKVTVDVSAQIKFFAEDLWKTDEWTKAFGKQKKAPDVTRPDYLDKVYRLIDGVAVKDKKTGEVTIVKLDLGREFRMLGGSEGNKMDLVVKNHAPFRIHGSSSDGMNKDLAFAAFKIEEWHRDARPGKDHHHAAIGVSDTFNRAAPNPAHAAPEPSAPPESSVPPQKTKEESCPTTNDAGVCVLPADDERGFQENSFDLSKIPPSLLNDGGVAPGVGPSAKPPAATR